MTPLHQWFWGIPNHPIALEQIRCDANWFPFELRPVNGKYLVFWCHSKWFTFDNAFFYDEVKNLQRGKVPENDVGYTDLEALLTLSDSLPQQEDNLTVIFHLSRCGSTLMGLMLNQLHNYSLLSEPQPLDFILRVMPEEHRFSDSKVEQLLQAILSVWQHFFARQNKKLVIKPDCWLTLKGDTFLQSGLVGESYFLTRELTEVIASQQEKTAAFMVPEMLSSHWFGLDNPGAAFLQPDGYQLDVLCRIYKAGIELVNSGLTQHVDYEQLINGDYTWLAPDARLSDKEKEKINSVLAVNVKKPNESFKSDKERKSLILSEIERQNIRQKQQQLTNTLLTLM